MCDSSKATTKFSMKNPKKKEEKLQVADPFFSFIALGIKNFCRRKRRKLFRFFQEKKTSNILCKKKREENEKYLVASSANGAAGKATAESRGDRRS